MYPVPYPGDTRSTRSIPGVPGGCPEHPDSRSDDFPSVAVIWCRATRSRGRGACAVMASLAVLRRLGGRSRVHARGGSRTGTRVQRLPGTPPLRTAMVGHALQSTDTAFNVHEARSGTVCAHLTLDSARRGLCPTVSRD